MPSLKKDLFIFVDESGNFDFTSKGTSHFVLGAIATFNPEVSANEMNKLKYEVLASGNDLVEFHASEDLQQIRDIVFPLINSLSNIYPHVIYGDKHCLAPNLQNDFGIYSLFGRAMIRYYLSFLPIKSAKSINIIFDQALTKKKRGYFESVLKPELKSLNIPFHIYFHMMKTDLNGQIADYLAWAKYVELEKSEHRPWTSLSSKLNPTDFNIFRNSHTRYY